MAEEWRDIPQYKGLYQASKLGNIRSLDRYKLSKEGSKSSQRGRVLKPMVNVWGYLTVALYKGGARKIRPIHQLIWETFNGEIPRPLVIDHIDSDKLNNSLTNLQALSNRDNCAKAASTRRQLPTGCYYRKDTGKYTSKIEINKKSIYLGNFNCPTAAVLAYQKALRSVL
jgi:hypothetical protein